jgi:hypothetical protein
MMNAYKMPIKRLSPCGSLVKIKVVALEILPEVLKIDHWHGDHLIGSIICEVGDMGIFVALEILMDRYFKSEEFKAFRKEAGTWN